MPFMNLSMGFRRGFPAWSPVWYSMLPARWPLIGVVSGSSSSTRGGASMSCKRVTGVFRTVGATGVLGAVGAIKTLGASPSTSMVWTLGVSEDGPLSASCAERGVGDTGGEEELAYGRSGRDRSGGAGLDSKVRIGAKRDSGSPFRVASAGTERETR